MMMVPTVLSSDRRIARPTAWTMSTWERRGSMKATPSRVGTSMPSDRHWALVSTALWLASTLRSRLSRRLRSPVDISPETWSVTNSTFGRWRGGIHETTLGSMLAKLLAVLIREWKVMVRRRS